ncbi:protein unzipped [Drosophila hydei]|uniref:Protein unzipped n=1 Tax=Drosophila hydei TaxID=7224 RepID=A0A6J1LAV3_DROHY|nr:protein unzipped [Drosophila hydei]
MSRRRSTIMDSISCRSSCQLTGIACILALLQLLTPSQAHTHPVLTYKNASTQLGQLVTSSTLVWETYDPKDAKQMQSAVEGGKYITEEEHYPIYVCRVTIDGVRTSGHTEKKQQKHVCVAALFKHAINENFDVLMNRGHLGKIAWKHWTKFNAGIPVGAILIGDESFIARHRAVHPTNAEGVESHRGADYNLGRLEPLGLGKIKVAENEREKYYDDGEVLVETEPFSYELRDIKLDRLRTSLRENMTELASSILENRGDTYATMEKIISYSFDYLQYWGSHEGVAKGLPTKIYEKNLATPAEINWALKRGEKRHENKAVFSKLWPGTAINVTLLGNYVTLEAPYTAKLSAFYYDSESVSRKISAEVRKSYLKDVKMEFSPVYWIENGTLVPTTTTTSTTSTTTHATTTSTNEPTPIHEPPMVRVEHVGDKHSGPDSLEKTLNDSTSTNEVNSHEAPENMSSKDAALAGFGVGGSNSAIATIQATGYAVVALISTMLLNL